MDIARSFSFMFDDADRIKKILIGAVVGIIPILNLAGIGYLVQLVRNVQAGEANPLPDWDDFGTYFMDGLKILVGLLFYSIPVILLSIGFVIIAVIVSEIVNPSDVDDVMGVLSICINCLTFILAMIPYIFLPAMLIRYADTEQISALIKVGELWRYIQQDLGSYVIVLAISLAVSIFIAPLGLIACVIGVFVTQWWAYLVSGHLTGQYARQNMSSFV